MPLWHYSNIGQIISKKLSWFWYYLWKTLERQMYYKKKKKGPNKEFDTNDFVPGWYFVLEENMATT